MVELAVDKKLSALEGEDPNELVCGIPRSKFFGVTQMKALIIIASDYSGLREN